MPELSLSTLALLLLAAAVAGCVDAAVGGGGLIQLPALLMVFPGQGLLVHALATNKLASVCGTAASVVTFARRVRLRRRMALILMGGAAVGGALGALIAPHMPKQVIYPILLVVMIGIAVYTVARPQLGTVDRDLGAHLATALALGCIGVSVGIYDGVLGPGTGTFLVIALVAITHCDFLRGSAYAKFGNLATNLGALLAFVPQGVIHWQLGLAMGCANLVGGYVGTRVVIAGGRSLVRTVFLVMLSVLVVVIAQRWISGA